MIVRRPILALALFAAAGPAVAQPTACLTETEARSVAAFALPAVIEATVKRCRPLLRADAWLNRGGMALAGRYRRDGGGDPAAAIAVLERLSGQQFPAFLDPGTATQAAEALIADQVGQRIPTRDCAPVAAILEQLSPLPFGNVAALLVAALRLGGGGATARAGVRICTGAAARG